MNFSQKGLIGTVFGGAMLASVSGADAAAPRCDDIDLSRAPDIKSALTLCLTGQPQPEPVATDDANARREITPARCDKERNRAINAFETVCRFDIPADASCPADVDKESRVGNRFPSKYLVEDRNIGTRSCTYNNLVPPTLKR